MTRRRTVPRVVRDCPESCPPVLMAEARREYQQWLATQANAAGGTLATERAGPRQRITRAKLAERNAEIVARFRAGETQQALAAAYGITPQRIAQITQNARRTA